MKGLVSGIVVLFCDPLPLLPWTRMCFCWVVSGVRGASVCSPCLASEDCCLIPCWSGIPEQLTGSGLHELSSECQAGGARVTGDSCSRVTRPCGGG